MIKERENIVKFFLELGQMWRVKHAGWTIAGVKDPESIAEHSHRAAQIGYVLAFLEGVDPAKVVLMVLIHDNGEARVNDSHRVANRYVNIKQAEVNAALEQFKRLPRKVEKAFREIYQEFEERKTKEAQCAKDADYLEQAIAAKEYIDLGVKGCQDWINNIKKVLKTKTAKELIKVIEKTDINDWWQGLKKLPSKS